ncbi:hypothetical protein KL936_003071 [Ogataea polymorpha]|nr:hypothetical protein KL936_003071 [Ogataea polymorpha]
MSKPLKNPSIAKLVDPGAVGSEQVQGGHVKPELSNQFAAPTSASSSSSFSSNGLQSQQAAQQANIQAGAGQYYSMQQHQQAPQQYGASFLPPPNPINMQQAYYIPFFPNPYYNPSQQQQQQQQISQQRFSSNVQPSGMPSNGALKLPTFSGNSPYYQKGSQLAQASSSIETPSQNIIASSPYIEGSESGAALKPNPYGNSEAAKRSLQSIDPENETKPYKCSQCDWAFIRHSDLRRHTRSHGNPEYHCPYWHPEYATCPHRNQGSFNRLDVLKRHLRLVHFDPEIKEQGRDGLVRRQDAGTCLSCGKYFASSKAFIEHVDDCALNTPMEQWRYKKNGIVTSVKKERGKPFEDKLPQNSDQEFPGNIEQKVITGNEILVKSERTKFRDSNSTESLDTDATTSKRLASSLEGAKNGNHDYLKRPRGRPRKLVS